MKAYSQNIKNNQKKSGYRRVKDLPKGKKWMLKNRGYKK